MINSAQRDRVLEHLKIAEKRIARMKGELADLPRRIARAEAWKSLLQEKLKPLVDAFERGELPDDD